MKRPIYLYGLSMAILLFLLQAVEYRYLVYDLQVEFFVGFMAVLFTALGLWIGWKLTAHRKQSVVAATSNVAMSDSPIEALSDIPQIELKPVRLSATDVGISPREEQVLRLIAAGHSNQEIADSLFLSLNTIKKHTSTLFRKLEAERRTQAIEKARQMGILE